PNIRWRQDVESDAQRIECLHRLLDDVDGSIESKDALRGAVGLPPQRMDIPLRRRRRKCAEQQRTVEVDRRRVELERDLERGRTAVEAVGPRRGDRRAVEW